MKWQKMEIVKYTTSTSNCTYIQCLSKHCLFLPLEISFCQHTIKWLISVFEAQWTVPWGRSSNCLFSHTVFWWCNPLLSASPLHTVCVDTHEKSVFCLLAHVAGESSRPESVLNLCTTFDKVKWGILLRTPDEVFTSVSLIDI